MRTKIFLVLLIYCLSGLTSFAGNKDKDIKMEELPSQTINFVKTYFSDVDFNSIVQIKKNKCYQLKTEKGWMFTFGQKGAWIDLDCNQDEVPAAVVPAEILNETAQLYGTNVKVVKITITRRKNYMIKLSNDIRIAFDRNLQAIKN